MRKISPGERKWQILSLSANSEIELEQHCLNMLHFFKQYPDVNLADAAYALNLNQLDLRYRLFAVADSVNHLIDVLEAKNKEFFFIGSADPFQKANLCFLMPGQATDYKLMGKCLYESEPIFKSAMDECSALIKKHTSIDILNYYYYSEIDIKSLPWPERCLVTLTAVLAIEYSFAQLLIVLGLTPTAFIGYSMGEVAAAILANTLSLEDGIKFMIAVANASSDQLDGGLLAVKGGENEVSPYLQDGVEIASVNAPDSLIIGGHKEALANLIRTLSPKEFFLKRLNIPCSYHTSFVSHFEAVLKPCVSQLTFYPNQYPLSFATVGRFIETNEIGQQDYWLKLFCRKMDMQSAVEKFVETFPNSFFIEAGPMGTMKNIIRKITENLSAQASPLMPKQINQEEQQLMIALGKAWLHGCEMQWSKLYAGQKRFIRPLPKSPFENYHPAADSTHEKAKQINVHEPLTDNEKTVLDIFKRVLAYSDISADSHFFNLGGDSLLAMQCIAMLNEQGFNVSLSYFRNYPTVRDIAKCYDKKNQDSDEDDRHGFVPLIPLQLRFFKKPKHWSEQKLVPTLVKMPLDINIHVLKEACQAVLDYHDALRLRFTHNEDGWQQFIINNEIVTFNEVSLPGKKESDIELEVAIAHEQGQFNLQEGPMIRFSLVSSQDWDHYILVISCHHLCVDGFSIGVAVKDLSNFYQQLLQDKPLSYPCKSTSFKAWALALHSMAQNYDKTEVAFWEGQAQLFAKKMPIDAGSGKPNLASSVREFTVNLSQKETEFCLRTLPKKRKGIGILETLLWSCAKAFYMWTHIDTFFVDLRRHGRDIESEELNLTRTVGWLTIVHPLLIQINQNADMLSGLTQVKQAMEQIPNFALGYGILRYLCKDTSIRDRMDKLNRAEIAFNYHGQLDNLQSEIKPFFISRYPIANSPNTTATRSHLINIDAMVINKRLQITLSYSKDFHTIEAIKKYGELIIENLKSLFSSDFL